MARQYLADGPYIDPGVADALGANASTSAVDAWTGATFTPIFANDPKAGKIYVVKAAGLITTASTGALTLSPGLGTSTPGTTMGASIAQTVPATSLSGPWYMELVIVVRTVGGAGANSTCMANGVFISGGVAATANSGLQVPFGGTSCAFDATVNNFVTVQKTLSVAGSWTTHWAFIYSMN